MAEKGSVWLGRVVPRKTVLEILRGVLRISLCPSPLAFCQFLLLPHHPTEESHRFQGTNGAMSAKEKRRVVALVLYLLEACLHALELFNTINALWLFFREYEAAECFSELLSAA